MKVPRYTGSTTYFTLLIGVHDEPYAYGRLAKPNAMRSHSAHVQATVYVEYVSGNVGCFVRCEEANSVGDIFVGSRTI